MTDSDVLPVVRAADLADPEPHRRWLVESLWTRAGVGIVGGAPKACKSWLGLDLALSVASNTPCLGRFAVHDPGPALLYMAEDGPADVKQRLLGLCRGRGLDLARVPLDVITSPSLRLDIDRDRLRVDRTLRRHRPRVLLLDPFVRLHRVDENSAAEVSALLAFLREMQREHDVAIVVVHHARKSAAGSAGQALRGSGDFHAWIDSALYVRRHSEHLTVAIEHRAAPAPEPIHLVLAGTDAGDAALVLIDPQTGQPSTAEDLRPRILAHLDAIPGGASRDELRAALRVRTDRIGPELAALAREGLVHRDGGTWKRVPVPPP
ncbi:MAG: AAA family ATPase [Polyangiaceae bacterium]